MLRTRTSQALAWPGPVAGAALLPRDAANSGVGAAAGRCLPPLRDCAILCVGAAAVSAPRVPQTPQAAFLPPPPDALTFLLAIARAAGPAAAMHRQI